MYIKDFTRERAKRYTTTRYLTKVVVGYGSYLIIEKGDFGWSVFEDHLLKDVKTFVARFEKLLQAVSFVNKEYEQKL
tara:strand:+ start:2017 stop:2247 length:231 start_codon:yes stop_codon:yes gene_type:complete